ncbi:MAG TPA: hypothetical protein VGK93_08205 [Candidatus Eisenbacteria bacterium]|jgi:hypothetical protein
MSWQLEALLVATGPDGRDVPIARTRATGAVRILGNVLVGEARAEAAALRRLDPLLGRIGSAEARRLATVLESVADGRDPGPALGLVQGGSER